MSGSRIRNIPSRRVRLIGQPEHPRGFYLRQAMIIALALTAAVAVVCLTFERESWNLWLTGACILVVLSIGRTALRIANSAFDSRVVFGASLVGANDESGISGVLFVCMLVLFVVGIPVIAPLLLVWNLIQAFEARPAGPGEHDGWFR